MKRVFVILLILALPVVGWAQTPDALFEERVLAAATAADREPLPRAVIRQTVVGIRIDRLFDRPGGVTARIRLNVDDHDWVARVERVDRDSAGFRSWVGAIESIPNSHVVFTERHGVLSG